MAELGAEIGRDYAGASRSSSRSSRAHSCSRPTWHGRRRSHTRWTSSTSRATAATPGRSRIRLLKDLDLPIAGRDVLLVENVVDTGLTLNYVVKTLTLRNPAGIAICTLFDRPYRRLVDDLPMRYVGFTIPDEFFLGYGFDLHERYRGLPDVHVAEE